MALMTEDRFLEKVWRGDGCWLWTGAISPNGYGRLGKRYAHRLSYELFVGPVPEGLQLDHVKERGCATRACVNPDHLEPVTQRENMKRGTIHAVNPSKMFCPKGHPYNEANTRIYQGRRWCRACDNERGRLKRRQPRG